MLFPEVASKFHFATLVLTRLFLYIFIVVFFILCV